ncbi:hypothetical protein MKX07_001620 [Trichoderma sp. CBMAI-0711]|nr:hypothetical protein MKX07_001620 [Trichoderma sp. CBMAI-0711]
MIPKANTRALLRHNRPDAFPSSEAFDAINAALSSSEADRKDAIKNGKAVFAFTLKNKAGETASWHIDLKETGTVGTGLGENPTGTIPSPLPSLPFSSFSLPKELFEGGLSGLLLTLSFSLLSNAVTLTLSDEDFGKLVSGKAQAQRLFMSGKLKVKGDVMKATKMEPILKKAQTKSKL